MKLGKTSWLILILGIFIIAFGSLGVTRAQQVKEQSEAEDNLAVAEKRLSNLQLRDLQNDKLNLEQQLEQAEYQLNQAQESLQQPIASIVVTDTLFDIAEDCGVVITQVSSTDIGKDMLQDVNYFVIRLSIVAEGEVLNLVNFVTKLNTDLPTGVVQSADISTNALEAEPLGETGASENETGESEEETEGEVIPSARIQLIIHSY